MLLFLLVVLVEFIQNMSVYNTKASSRKGDTKENFLLQRFLKQNYEQQLLHNNVDEGLKLICGMTDFSQQQNHINNPELYSTTPNFPSNKRPLLAANLNSLKNIRNNHTNNNTNTVGFTKPQHQPIQSSAKNELSEETIRNNVQIVLNNIQRNAIKHQQQQQQHQQQMLKSAGGGMMSSPESDFNSNLYLGCGGAATMLGCSIASSHDFTHDNSDYQWFLDYGYRDGITHQSVLSSLSASYNGIGELSYYEDLAKNIDANLAEVDMESFRTEDIHSLLTTTIPTFCHKKSSDNVKCKRNLDLDNSICKSELLFSPVRESHISVDSLDMDGYPNEEDIILTCQANKDNYTIAFEGSVMYSDESFYDGPEFTQKYKQQQSMNIMQLENIVRKKAMEVSMSRSDNGLTTWSKLRKNSSQQQLPSRCPSRNNNIQANQMKRHLPHCFVHKSSSMPNLKATQQQPPLNVSQAISNSSVDSYGKLRSLLPMYQMPISTSDNDDVAAGHHHNTSASNNEVQQQHQSTETGACDNNENQQKLHTTQEQQQQHLQPSFNLVKLFIKQKSSSTDTCMDVSSGCWPSDSTNSSSGDNNNSNNNNNLTPNNINSNINNQQRLRKKSMNDSGKGSALSRHDEEELRRHHEHEMRKVAAGGAAVDGDDDFPYDSLDPQINNSHRPLKETNDFNREVFDSPSRRLKKNYREFNMNIRNQIKNPIVFNLMNNNSISNNSYKDTTSDSTLSRTSENLTQIFNSNSSKTTSKIPIEMLTKSMQTSTSAFVNTATAVAAAAANTKEKYRIVPPSFLAQLNKLGDEQKAPVFVIYPNYALPDLGFLKQQQQPPDQVILSPLSFKEPFSLKNRQQLNKRPFSMNATDNFYLNRQEYKHIKDWQSLMTLLPREYRKLLKNIPECQEANKTMMDASMSSQKPMFCMTPPIRRGCGVGGSRPVSCDCVSILTQTNTNYSGSSSGESSSQPPSSGYRGSSTMLTDSELDGLGSNNSLKNMYVYQYEASGGSGTTDDNSHPQRPPSGRHQQRGILRRTNTNIRLPPAKGGAAGKRNSMFEDPALQGMTIAEKRRSLQDPYYMTDTYNIIEDFIAETNAEQMECDQQPPEQGTGSGGLPNYPKQRDSDVSHKFNKMKQQLRDFDLNKAVTNKLNAEKEDLAARMRAENFLTNVPKSELKHYAEVANLLESIIDESKDMTTYDCSKLRNVVSRALSSQKRVSFDGADNAPVVNNKCLLRPNELHFTTPPNSPNMSTIHSQAAINKGLQQPKLLAKQMLEMGDKEKQDKVACNRFKRLQIQWELLSKESAALAQDMQNNGECLVQCQVQRDTKSGGNTPNGGISHSAATAAKSRIPRPVSYPTSKGTPEHHTPVKTLKSPSRMAPPKKYSAPTPTPAPRTPSKVMHTTPKRAAPIPRTVSRTR